jgi:hypothetical protein
MLVANLAIALLVVVTAYSAIVSFRERPEGATPTWFFPNGAERWSRISVGIVSLAIIVAVISCPSHRRSSQRSLRFLIPEGYSGWVRVEFEVSGAPPLPEEADQSVVKFPAEGKFKTSSPEQYGWANDSYYFYSGSQLRPLADSGPQQLIWGKINGEAVGLSGKRKYEEFFVGTEQQFRDQAKPEHGKGGV